MIKTTKMIREAKLILNLSIADVAFMVGASPRTVCRWLSGTCTPQYHHRMKIYDLYANIYRPKNEQEHSKVTETIKIKTERNYVPHLETNIGSLLSNLKNHLELSQVMFAKYLGYDPNAIYRWLHGRSIPHRSTAEIIYQAQTCLPYPLTEKQFWTLYEQDIKERNWRRNADL